MKWGKLTAQEIHNTSLEIGDKVDGSEFQGSRFHHVHPRDLQDEEEMEEEDEETLEEKAVPRT